MIKVLVVDDQDLMLQGLTMLVGKENNLEVIGSCYNGKEAVEFCNSNEVDVILMDIRMPVMTGVEATKLIIENNPKVKIIILTTFTDDEYIFSSLRNGAAGYLLKDAKPVEITNAIEKVYQGGTLINPDIATKLISAMREGADLGQNIDKYKKDSKTKHLTERNEIVVKQVSNSERDKVLEDLTNREKDICHHLAEGKNNKEIGEILIISEGTVKNNITRILDKLNMRDRTQLALFAMKYKI